jgi:hypothetical protein
MAARLAVAADSLGMEPGRALVLHLVEQRLLDMEQAARSPRGPWMSEAHCLACARVHDPRTPCGAA